MRYIPIVGWLSGGASGLGEACRRRLANKGARIAIADITINAAQVLAHSLRATGTEAPALHCDVTDQLSVEFTIQTTLSKFRRFRRLDPAVDNVGMACLLTGIAQYPLQTWNNVISVIEPNGYVKITDRLKDVIKTGGEWVSSLELENLIAGMLGVAEAAVIGVPDAKWGERPWAIVVESLPLQQVR